MIKIRKDRLPYGGPFKLKPKKMVPFYVSKVFNDNVYIIDLPLDLHVSYINQAHYQIIELKSSSNGEGEIRYIN